MWACGMWHAHGMCPWAWACACRVAQRGPRRAPAARRATGCARPDLIRSRSHARAACSRSRMTRDSPATTSTWRAASGPTTRSNIGPSTAPSRCSRISCRSTGRETPPRSRDLDPARAEAVAHRPSLQTRPRPVRSSQVPTLLLLLLSVHVCICSARMHTH
eukprot:5279043-Prymnesium_polylepis.1